MHKLAIRTNKKKDIIDITDLVSESIKTANKTGVVNLFVLHTTAALTTADLDPGGTDLDYLDAFEQLIPKLDFRHPHDPLHMPDHIISSLIGPSLTLPVENGRLVLGAWQRVVLIELAGPRDRQIVISD